MTATLKDWTCETLVEVVPVSHGPVKDGKVFGLLAEISEILGTEGLLWRVWEKGERGEWRAGSEGRWEAMWTHLL